MGPIAETIHAKLSAAFGPDYLEVQDQSHRHAGHGGAAEYRRAFPDREHSPETHLHVVIQATALSDLGRLARHRAVMDAVRDEVDRIHAFSVEFQS